MGEGPGTPQTPEFKIHVRFATNFKRASYETQTKLKIMDHLTDIFSLSVLSCPLSGMSEHPRGRRSILLQAGERFLFPFSFLDCFLSFCFQNCSVFPHVPDHVTAGESGSPHRLFQLGAGKGGFTRSPVDAFVTTGPVCLVGSSSGVRHNMYESFGVVFIHTIRLKRYFFLRGCRV